MENKKIVSQDIIKAIQNKYDKEFNTKIVLDIAEELIIKYFYELKDTLKNYINILNDKIKLDINTDEYIVYFKMENEYLYFKRGNECISVFMKIDNKECHYRDICPNEELDNCVIGAYIFNESEINRIIKKAFNFIKE